MFNKLYNLLDDLSNDLYNHFTWILNLSPFYEEMSYKEAFLYENFNLLNEYLQQYPDVSTPNLSSCEELSRHLEAHKLKQELAEWWELERPLSYTALEELKAKQDKANPNIALTNLIQQKEWELEQLDYIQLTKLISLYPYFDQPPIDIYQD